MHTEQEKWLVSEIVSLMEFFIYGIYAYENLGAFLFGFYMSNQVMCH